MKKFFTPKTHVLRQKNSCFTPKNECFTPKNVCFTPKNACFTPKNACFKPKNACFKPKNFYAKTFVIPKKILRQNFFYAKKCIFPPKFYAKKGSPNTCKTLGTTWNKMANRRHPNDVINWHFYHVIFGGQFFLPGEISRVFLQNIFKIAAPKKTFCRFTISCLGLRHSVIGWVCRVGKKPRYFFSPKKQTFLWYYVHLLNIKKKMVDKNRVQKNVTHVRFNAMTLYKKHNLVKSQAARAPAVRSKYHIIKFFLTFYIL